MTNRPATIRRLTGRADRAAFTMFELAVAVALLIVLMAFTVQVMRLVSRQQRTIEKRVVALETVQAVAEQIGNVPWNELTPDAMEQIAIPDQMKARLPGSKLTVRLADEDDPAAKRITIELQTGEAGRPGSAMTRLTTWSFRDLP